MKALQEILSLKYIIDLLYMFHPPGVHLNNIAEGDWLTN